jgi:protein-tyrosine phosphatase
MIDLEYRIFFVCMGNICRSPTTEAVFYKRLADCKLLHTVKIDSAGTHNFHPDAPPDERSQAHALKRGYDSSNLRDSTRTGFDRRGQRRSDEIHYAKG